MPENEFERKVQERMEELRIRPSDETWERVEKELREKKKRRAAVLFFIMAGLLLLGYSGYTFLANSSNQPVVQNEIKKSPVETTQPSVNTSTTTTNTTNNKPAVAETTGRTPNTNLPDENRSTNLSLTHKTVIGNPGTSERTREKNRQLPGIVKPGKLERTTIANEDVDLRQTKDAGADQKENNQVANSNQTAISGKPLYQPEKTPEQKPVNNKDGIISIDIAANSINNKVQVPADTAVVHDSAIAKIEENKIAAPETEESKPAIANNKNISKWKFGVEVSGGFISSQNKVFGFIDGGPKSLFDQLQSGYSGAAGGVGTGSNAPRVTPPSPVKAGKSLKIGMVAEKAISKRSSVSAGLRYSYADESLEVGAVRDTVIRSNSYSFSQNFLAVSGVRSAYSNSPSSSAAAPRPPIEYTNKYHFLEIPLLFQTQLNKGRKMGILWNAGIAPGFLIGTNALVYDTAAKGIYYRNDNAFKKFHFNMQTGFALQFGNNKKIQWAIGPAISLDMTRLMKEDVFTERRYFLYTGLTSRLFLNSRKK